MVEDVLSGEVGGVTGERDAAEAFAQHGEGLGRPFDAVGGAAVAGEQTKVLADASSDLPANVGNPLIELGTQLALAEREFHSLMLDLPKHRTDQISASLQKHHPKTVVRGRDPTIPAFP